MQTQRNTTLSGARASERTTAQQVAKILQREAMGTDRHVQARCAEIAERATSEVSLYRTLTARDTAGEHLRAAMLEFLHDWKLDQPPGLQLLADHLASQLVSHNLAGQWAATVIAAYDSNLQIRERVSCPECGRRLETAQQRQQAVCPVCLADAQPEERIALGTVECVQ